MFECFALAVAVDQAKILRHRFGPCCELPEFAGFFGNTQDIFDLSAIKYPQPDRVPLETLGILLTPTARRHPQPGRALSETPAIFMTRTATKHRPTGRATMETAPVFS